jgi:hypothetical protein
MELQDSAAKFSAKRMGINPALAVVVPSFVTVLNDVTVVVPTAITVFREVDVTVWVATVVTDLVVVGVKV